MSLRYDPLVAPNAEAWLALGELERIQAVERDHRRRGEKLPNLRIHASIHVIVENQLALGDPPEVRAKLDQLMDEGLDRHEAVHAIGCVLTDHMQRIVHEKTASDPNASYIKELRGLTMKKWLEEYGE